MLYLIRTSEGESPDLPLIFQPLLPDGRTRAALKISVLKKKEEKKISVQAVLVWLQSES